MYGSEFQTEDKKTIVKKEKRKRKERVKLKNKSLDMIDSSMKSVGINERKLDNWESRPKKRKLFKRTFTRA